MRKARSRVAMALASLLGFAGLTLTTVESGAAASPPPPAAETAQTAVLKLKVVGRGGQGIPRARVAVGDQAPPRRTGGHGRARVRLGLDGRSGALVTLRIAAGDAGSLVERQIPLAAGVLRRYRVEMRGNEVKRYFAGVSRERIDPLQRAAQRKARRTLRRGARTSAVPGMCSGWTSLTQPPSSIKVARRTNNSPSGSIYRVDTVDYKTYTKRVLPQEWGIGWNPESLKAGSLAIKAYAWNRAVTQSRRTTNSGECYDVDDSVNYQVYRESTASSTNAAVDSTWSTWVRKNNQTFWAGYTAGPVGAACGAGNDGGTHMWQNGTKTCADAGKSYADIVDDYYFPVTFFTLDVAPFGNELGFVAQQYLDFYGRPIPAADASWLIAALWNGTTATGEIDSVLRSSESEGRGMVAIARLYYAAFDRQPDKGAIVWAHQNTSLLNVASAFLNSSEGKQKLPTNPEAFVRKLYTNALNRNASASEVSYWAGQVRSKGRASVLVAISQSSEHKKIRRGMAPLQAIYLAMLGRPADSGAYNHWLPILDDPAASPFLIETIRRSAEYNRRIN